MEIERSLQGRGCLGSPGQDTLCLETWLFTSASEIDAWSEGAGKSLVENLRFFMMNDALPSFSMGTISAWRGFNLRASRLHRKGSASSPKPLLLVFLILALSHPGSAERQPLPIPYTRSPSQQAAKLRAPNGICACGAEGIAATR